RQFSVTIAGAPGPLTISSPALLAPGSTGISYSQNLTATGGNGQYSWTLTGGSLPAGLLLAPNGLISGTPTTAQTANFTASASSGNSSVSAQFSILITNPANVSLLAANPLPNG